MDEEIQGQPEMKTSKLAIVSLILPFTCIGAFLGIILGIAAAIQISRNRNKLKGMGFASNGIALSITIVIIQAAIITPSFVSSRWYAQSKNCLTNVKHIQAALSMYATDHNDTFPPAAGWSDAIKPYVKDPKILKCPADKTGGPSYALNAQAAGISAKDMPNPGETVLIFESKPGQAIAGGRELLIDAPRHFGYSFRWPCYTALKY